MIYPFRGHLPKYDESVFIAPSSDLIGDIKIGEQSSIWFGCVIRADIHKIRIGTRSNIQDMSMIHVDHYKNNDKSTGHPTIIGDNVTIGHKVMLHGCIVEDACLVGMSSTILDGACIGKESIVGAGSLITKGKKFPPRSLIMGSPAKFIRELTEEEIVSLYKSADNYVKWSMEYL